MRPISGKGLAVWGSLLGIFAAACSAGAAEAGGGGKAEAISTSSWLGCSAFKGAFFMAITCCWFMLVVGLVVFANSFGMDGTG